MRKLPDRMPARKYQMGVSKRRPRNRFSTRLAGGERMLKVGDPVVYLPDGSRGTVVEVLGGLYHIVWEDHFSSWERADSLNKQEASPG
jgi:hypothetical protein